MTFIPGPGKIEIEPIVKEKVLGNDELLEAGIVVGIGKLVSDFLDIKVGDTVFFLRWGVYETPEMDGKKHFIIEGSTEYILGYAPAE